VAINIHKESEKAVNAFVLIGMAANLKADFFATRKKNSERKFYK
jgi:hypothetical protein